MSQVKAIGIVIVVVLFLHLLIKLTSVETVTKLTTGTLELAAKPRVWLLQYRADKAERKVERLQATSTPR